MGLPQQGSVDQCVASSLTNTTLAHRLEIMTANPRQFTRSERDAYTYEAAKRLRWQNVYENHQG